MVTYRILVLGASYGSLPAIRFALAGHSVTLVCTSATAQLINREGICVRMPVREREGLVQVCSRLLSKSGVEAKRVEASTPGQVVELVDDYDLVVFAMQEPQYQFSDVCALMQEIAAARLPCISIMNMPPPPFLQRIPDLDVKQLKHCYNRPELWEHFLPGKVTLASPDPQAFRPPECAKNVLQVALPTNFKAAAFEDDEDTILLRNLERDIAVSRFDMGGGDCVELPVKLKVHNSLYVPFAKWAMLIAGNYRCVQDEGSRSICEAVHSNLEVSRLIYEQVNALCVVIGASSDDMVSFEKYARAAEGLIKPSSVARALEAGAAKVERVDALVLSLSQSFGFEIPELWGGVERVNRILQLNQLRET